MIHGCAVDRREARQERRERGELVLVRVAREAGIRKIIGDLLQAQDVEVGQRLRRRDDSCGVDAAVDAPAPLYVPVMRIMAASLAERGRARPDGGPQARSSITGCRRA
jgi:hypothetical protein